MDDLDRLTAELHRRVEALIEALRPPRKLKHRATRMHSRRLRDRVAGKASLAELAFGDALRDRIAQEIAPLDNQGDYPEIEHRRMLMGLGRFMHDLRSLGPQCFRTWPPATRLSCSAEAGRVLRPVEPGPKAFDEIDLHLMRRCVLRVLVECARTGAKNQELFLRSLPHAPAYDGSVAGRSASRQRSERWPGDRRGTARRPAVVHGSGGIMG